MTYNETLHSIAVTNFLLHWCQSLVHVNCQRFAILLINTIEIETELVPKKFLIYIS